jgi:outer membrane protein assembly factor BamB
MENASRRPVLFFPFWVWVVLAAAVAITVIQTQVTDQGMANGFTWPVLIIATTLILLWFCFFSGRDRGLRYGILITAILLAVAFGILFRVEGLTGNIIPILSWRFGPSLRDREPTAPRGTGAVNVDLKTTTPADFPQFLGPKRDLSVDVKLARNWSTYPPKELWRNEVGAGWSGFAVVNGYAVTLEQRGQTEVITCYEAETGKLVWWHGHEARYETWIGGVGPRSTPAIHDGKVYALGGTGILFCLDGANGSVLWEQDLLKEFGMTPQREKELVLYGRANSPLIVDDLVVIPAGGPDRESRASLVAFDKNTGELVWKAGDRNVSYSSPAFAALAGIPQIVIVNENNVTGHDAATGKLLWEVPWPGVTSKDANVSQAVPLPPDRVYISKGYGGGSTLVKLAPTADGTLQPEVLWRNKIGMKTKFTNVTMKDGYVYGLSDGILECQELDTGKRVWRDGRYGHGQILRAGDLLLVLSEEGELLLVEATPETPNNVLGSIQALEGRTWNNLALAGDLLLVRNATAAVCYRLALAE